MGRIALFVIAVGGLSYLIIKLIVSRVIGVPVSSILAVSASIIVAVIAWTIFIWLAGDRLGRKTNARRRDE